jgi:hypothetical protein
VVAVATPNADVLPKLEDVLAKPLELPKLDDVLPNPDVLEEDVLLPNPDVLAEPEDVLPKPDEVPKPKPVEPDVLLPKPVGVAVEALPNPVDARVLPKPPSDDAPKLKPVELPLPLPLLTAAGAGSEPGLGFSQEAHLAKVSAFRMKQLPHSHLPSLAAAFNSAKDLPPVCTSATSTSSPAWAPSISLWRSSHSTIV